MRAIQPQRWCALACGCGLLTAALLLRRRLGHLDGRRLFHTHARVAAAAIMAAGLAAGTAHLTTAQVGTSWTGSIRAATPKSWRN